MAGRIPDVQARRRASLAVRVVPSAMVATPRPERSWSSGTVMMTVVLSPVGQVLEGLGDDLGVRDSEPAIGEPGPNHLSIFQPLSEPQLFTGSGTVSDRLSDQPGPDVTGAGLIGNVLADGEDA